MRACLALTLLLAACPAPPAKTCATPPCEGPTGATGGTGAPTDAEFGLDARPANPTCVALPRAQPAPTGNRGLVPAFPNLTFDNTAPVALAHVKIGPSGTRRWFSAIRAGKVQTWTDENAETVTDVLDLSSLVYGDGPGTNGEGGLLGMAFDPDIETDATKNKLYVHYTAWYDWGAQPDEGANVIARYTVNDDGTTVSATLDHIVLRTGSGGGNHWGGDLKFGPDKLLYASFGDGGNGYDNTDSGQARAQKLGWMRGRIIRIDPRSAVPYAIPPTNPHCVTANCATDVRCHDLPRATLDARTNACPETFVRGLRNPWRFSFDRTTGQLWIGDVGSSNEEINLASAGSNHGWPCYDGVMRGSNNATVCQNLAASDTKRPIAIYRLASMSSASVLGGYVYRGATFASSLGGTYIFSDVYDGLVYAISTPYDVAANIDAMPADTSRTLRHPDAGGGATFPRFAKLGLSAGSPVGSYAEDENGELYLLTFSTAKGRGILKLSLSSGTPDTFPARLSQTGCVVSTDPKTPASGLIPYDINAPFWSDGAAKARWLAVPDGQTITVAANGDFDFPVGSVLMKSFAFAGKLHETRLFMRHADGDWGGYSYAWASDESDAYLVADDGESRAINGQTWVYPSRTQCLTCHTVQAGRSLGLEVAQLNRDLVYPGNVKANELRTLEHIGLVTVGDPAQQPALVDPSGDAPLELRARSYLHTNCAQCHRDAARPDLTFAASLAATRLCEAPALIVPGDHAASKLSQLMHSTDVAVKMPKGPGTVIDMAGVTLVDQWIDSLTACP